MERLKQFVRDAWSLSAGPIRRADPLLMGAAIAYNGLFALVPLTLAFAALLTFFDRSDTVIDDLLEAIDANLPEQFGDLIGELLSDSYRWISGERGIILLVSIAVALWSGSRAVYAIQKALRTSQGLEDDRGYVRSRGLGIAVTVVAGFGVMVAYLAFVVGRRFWDDVAAALGIESGAILQSFAVGLIIVLVWLILWAIYRWGPPEPMPRSGIVAAVVAALLVLGTIVAFEVVPSLSSSSAVSLFGAVGVLLLWLYYVGIVIVAAPTLLTAIVGAVHEQVAR